MQYTGLSLISLYSLDDLDDVSESTIRSSSSFFEPDVEVSSRSAVSFSMPDKILLAIFALYMPLSLASSEQQCAQASKGIGEELIIRENGKRGSKGGAVMRALASHQCCPGSNPGVDAICGLSLLLVLSFAPRGFSPGLRWFSPLLKTNIFKFQFDLERTDTFKRVHMNFFCFASWVKWEFTNFFYNLQF